MDANGNPTTNSAGLLSPYGEFFPMQPGPAVLVTMPDIETGQRGTGVVHVIKLALDVNHDGTMDPSFAGPDNTSQDRPFVFWLNNDQDDTSMLGGGPGEDVVPLTWLPDYKSGFIPSQRDLEDWARLWVCGLPALTNANYQVTLSWGTVSSGAPAINLTDTVETNGGIGYLTVTNVAAAELQRAAGKKSPVKYPTITSTNALVLPSNLFTNGGNKYFLFEGAGAGSGQLVLTIAQTTGQGTNVLAQTSAWLDLHDVKDFYERAILTNNTAGAVSNWTSGIERIEYTSSPALGEDTNLIVFVHGFNVGLADLLCEGDTVFKRLYWSGYHGQFAAVHWPSEVISNLTVLSLDTDVFNRSELHAYKASAALATYVSQLRTRFTGYRLHLLVHSQGNSAVSEAIAQSGVGFDTYILSQGAIPASTYDVAAPTRPDLVDTMATPEWQPMGYRGVYTNLIGNLVNFYNPQDKVLDYWITDQHTFKPSVGYYYVGTTGLHGTNIVTDTQESRAMISRSRTEPIGHLGPATGQAGQGVIGSAVNLNAQFGFANTIDEHSAQWTRPIQTSRPYFQQVLIQIQPSQ